jgi:hypothetical protein
LSHLLRWRRRRLWDISLRSGISSCFVLRVRGLLEGGVVGPNLISVAVPRARRGLLGGRSEAGIEVNIVQSIQDEITRKRSSTRKLTMHRDQTLEESSSQVEEGGGCSKVRQGSRCRHHHQKRSECHQDLLNPRRHQRLVSSSSMLTMAMEQQRSIPPGPQ